MPDAVMQRVRACRVDELVTGHVVIVRLARIRDYMPREVMVLRDEDGRVVAYRNECKHLPIPIDGMTRRFFNKEGKHLLCALHGAQYRVEDGYCFTGPCRGESLERVPFEVVGEEVWLLDALGAETLKLL